MQISIKQALSVGLKIDIRSIKGQESLIIHPEDGIEVKSLTLLRDELINQMKFSKAEAYSLVEEVHEKIYHASIWNTLRKLDTETD